MRDGRAPREAARPTGPQRTANTGWAGRRIDRTPYSEFEVPFGAIGANFGYAMIATATCYEYGVTPEQLAKIAVAQRYNACHNPNALFFGQPITVDDVLNSPVIVDPLHLLEIVMPVAGAAALVVTSAKQGEEGEAPAGLHPRRRRAHDPPQHHLRAQPDRQRHQGAPPIRAFKMAGVRRKDIDLASIYDCYTITVLVSLEDAGFAKKGQGGRVRGRAQPAVRRRLPAQSARRAALVRPGRASPAACRT